MTAEDYFAFGSKYLGTYCPELSKPPGAVVFKSGSGLVSSIDAATGETQIGNTIVYPHEFTDELEIRKGNGGGDERTIAEQLITEIAAYNWEQEPEPPAATPAAEVKAEPDPAMDDAPEAQQIPITLPPSDPERQKNPEPLAAVLAAWTNAFGVGQLGTLNQAIELANHLEALRAALLAVAAMDDGQTISNVRLARWLRDHNEVPIDGLMLSSGGVDENGSPWWTLVTEPDPAPNEANESSDQPAPDLPATWRDITELRLQLRRNGFPSIPVEADKGPRMRGWQLKFDVSEEEIRRWEKTYPRARNTGVIAKFTPGLDIDITIEAAAKAVEALAREYFGQHGDIYVRFGNPPKRLIPLRTDEPFPKLQRRCLAPDGSKQAIEIPSNGQQYVVAGIHPKTGKPYEWVGGELATIKREDLPYVRREDMERFLDAATKLLIEESDFVLAGTNKTADSSKQLDLTQKSAGANGGKNFDHHRVAPEFEDLPVEELGEGIEELPPLPFAPIKEGCPWLRHVHNTGGADQCEPLWKLALNCCTFLAEGERLIHELSNQHAGYDPKATKVKYALARKDQKAKDLGWPLCQTVHDNGSTHCKACPHLAAGGSPLHLAHEGSGGQGKLEPPITAATLAALKSPNAGVPEFFNIVRTLKTIGFTVDGITALFERHPDGLAKNCRKPLHHQIGIVWGKLGEEKPALVIPFRRHGEKSPLDDRAWAVEGFIPEVGTGVIAGQWGMLKTFVALDLAQCIMTGRPFINQFKITRPGGVLMFALEGQSEVPIRIQGALEQKGSEYHKGAPFYWCEACPPLINPKTADPLIATAKAVAAEFKQRFNLPLTLILIDSLIAGAGYTKEGQDNDAVLAHTVKKIADKVSQALGCFVFIVDHFGKDVSTGTRGSSVKEVDADVIVACLGKRSEAGEITNSSLAIRKRRAGPTGEEFPFKGRIVPMGLNPQTGTMENTLVIDWDHRPHTHPTKKKDEWGRSKSVKLLPRIIMNLLPECGEQVKPFANGPSVRALKLELVETEFIKSYAATGDTEKAKKDAKRKALQRALDAAGDKIATREIGGVDYIWLVNPAPAETVTAVKSPRRPPTQAGSRSRSDDLPYTGPVVEMPDLGPDSLDEHGAPQE